MQRGLPNQLHLQLLQELVVVADHLQVGLDIQLRAALRKTIQHVAVTSVLQHLLERILVVLLIHELHVSQELAAASHEKHPASDQVAGGPHLAWVDIAQRERAATHEPSDLLTVELVVLLATVNGLHVQRVTEDELDLLFQA